jgi:selenium metabolism protein YedF
MEIDARGKACPTPVIMTKKALEEMDEGILTVLVDNFASKENVTKFVTSQGCSFEVFEDNGIFKIEIAKGYECKIAPKEDNKTKVKEKIVLYITSDKIGDDVELGKILLKGFIGNIKNMDVLPSTIIFVNTGVYVTTMDEESIEELKNLEDIEILSCGTCLTYFKIEKELKVGDITDAHLVMTRLFEADKVIRL